MAERKDISFKTNREKLSIAISQKHAGRTASGRVRVLYAHRCTDCGATRWDHNKIRKAFRCMPCATTFRRKHPKRTPFDCIRCGKQFRGVWRSARPPKFCSVKCHNAQQTETGLKNAVRITCKHCKKMFTVKPCQAKRVKVECCSNACKLAHHRWQNCQQCGKRFNARHNPDRVYCSKRCYLSSWGETRIEKVVRKSLEVLGLKAIPQYKVLGAHHFDFYIPDLNLLIEADGTYWHSRPWSQERDARKTAKARKQGFNVERFPESLIMSDKWFNTFRESLSKYPAFITPRLPL